MIYTIRVTSGQEKIIAEILMKKSRSEKLDVYSIVHVDNVKGYLFIESSDENTLVKLIQKVKHVKGFLRSPIALSEIENLLKTTQKPTLVIEPGDTVEMSSGPFKGERAKVVKIDDAKDEITVELIEVAVPIPVTVKSKMVKLFQKLEELQ
ncbi:transcription elongation factor Spt5 [Candidatus Micrarchaeota archaeon]|nr:transcription elongation factor Spt5 [Candidatus Micrarchaeota archaeon]MBU1165404.1 transcription elongation factor Spt5 [Candidatus Micrarchaeota archaeon]MBU1886453.1 transcription elongation factor Spt5 [Candidatus Micrarchaeota archaeon]